MIGGNPMTKRPQVAIMNGVHDLHFLVARDNRAWE